MPSQLNWVIKKDLLSRIEDSIRVFICSHPQHFIESSVRVKSSDLLSNLILRF